MAYRSGGLRRRQVRPRRGAVRQPGGRRRVVGLGTGAEPGEFVGNLRRTVELETVEVREAEVDLKNGTPPVKVAVAHSLKAARQLAEMVSRGESTYQFVEIMACPGGCMGGGEIPSASTPITNSEAQQGAQVEGVLVAQAEQQAAAVHAPILPRPVHSLAT